MRHFFLSTDYLGRCKIISIGVILKIIEIGAECWAVSGIGKAILKLNEEFIRKGHQSKVYCLVPSNYTHASSGYSSLKFFLKAVPYIKKLKPDVVHVHSSFPLGAIPFNNVVFTLWDPPLSKVGLFNRLVYNWVLRHGRKVVLLTEFLRESIPRTDVKIIPAGINEEIFRPKGKKKIFGLSILCVGTVGAKGEDILIKAFNVLRPEFPELKLVFIGRVRESQKLQLLKLCEHKDSISFVGPIEEEEELAEYYRGCTIFASATQYEGFGMPFIEANACGKSVVAFRVAAIPFVVSNGRTGLLADDFRQFVNHLRLLLSNKKIRERMGREGARIARQKFSWEKIAEKYIEMFEEALESK